jgi:hypothetical protein
MRVRLLVVLCLALYGCGYHVSGQGELLPKTIKTIAIPAFGNATVNSKLARLISEDVTREFISRTRYNIVPDASQADALLQGALVNFVSYPVVSDPVSGRSTGVQVFATLQLTLTDRHTGKTLFSRNGYEFRERYEITLDPQAYFDENGTAIIRLSRDVARSIVSAILQNF